MKTQPAVALPAQPTAAGSVPITTLLVVEDEASIREMLAVIMEMVGYRVLQAHDGHQAWEIPRVMISGNPLVELMRACGASQAAAVLSKPFDFATLSTLIGELLAHAPQLPVPRKARRAGPCAGPHRWA